MIITSEKGKEMLLDLPSYYETSQVMSSILQAKGSEFDKLFQALNEILDQFFVKTATWNLSKWEEELGLPPSTASDQERRERILSRLKGWGTATLSAIKEVVESYNSGNVEVIQDHSAYKVHITFIDTPIPPNINDLKDAVRTVLPAHLDVIYKYLYLLQSELNLYVGASMSRIKIITINPEVI